jgi:predicted negative regulator of RcsB-dependent stress response
MAIEDLDEHEQGERVRKWLGQNGGSIVLGICVGIAGLAGWHYWEQAARERTQAAQVEYQAFIDAEESKDVEAAAKAAATLRKDFSDTPYGVFAALKQSRDAVGKGDLAAAEEPLQWARGIDLDLPALEELVIVRLAQIKLAQGQAQAVLDLLKGDTSKGFKGVVADLRGDALVVLGRIDDARSAYEDALAALDAGSPQRSFVEMKRDDLAAPVATAAAPTPTPAPAAPTDPAAPQAPAEPTAASTDAAKASS